VKYLLNSSRRRNVKLILDSARITHNNPLVFDSNKSAKIFIKQFRNSCFDEIFSLSATSQKSNKNDVVAFGKSSSFVISCFLLSLVGLKSKTIGGVVWPTVNAQILCNYIAEQVTGPISQQSKDFKQGVLSGIAKLTMSMIKQMKVSNDKIIAGFKVECCGR